MGQPHEPQRVFFHVSNPLRKILRHSSVQNQTLLASLKSFESVLSYRFDKLRPKNYGPLDLVWMISAMGALLETHTDVKNLISDFGKPLINWEDNWVNAYLDNSMKLLDMCNAFSSEISHLTHFHLILKHALYTLEQHHPCEKNTISSSLDEYTHNFSRHSSHIILFSDAMVADSLKYLPKKHCSGKEKVVMRAMFGLNVFTVFLYRVFMAVFSGSAEIPTDFEVGRRYSWGDSFNILMEEVLRKKGSVAKEVKDVNEILEKLKKEEKERGMACLEIVCELKKEEERLGRGLEGLREEVDRVFHCVFQRREEFLSCIRDNFFGPINVTSSFCRKEVKDV